MRNSLILAVHSGHNASAALMQDGRIAVAALEERFIRKKNFVGYPRHAIDYCLGKAQVKGADLDRLAYTTNYVGPSIYIKAKTTTQFTLRDYMDFYGDKYYRRRFRGEDCIDYLRWLRDDPQFNEDEEAYDFSYLSDEILRDVSKDMPLLRGEQSRVLASHVGVAADKVEFIDHHTCHAYYAYFGSPFRGADCIALTLDGEGDGRNQTVWRVKDDELTLLAESSENDLGHIYKMATLILGMRPDEHEFKVMGLAPYAKSSYVESAKKILDGLCAVEGMRVVSKNRPRDLYSHLEEGWKDHRFDNIAGAAQAYTEEIACTLVRDIAQTTGISRFVLSGGISMNVKMNKAIAELDEVESLFVCGSGGDESLAIGGCYYLNREAGTNTGLDHLYLGYDIQDELGSFDPGSLQARFDVRRGVSPAEIAKLLSKGDIVAVTRGKAEFGARALGNRSILADPRKRESVKKINEAIKNRDFWMPFALSMLEEHQSTYFVNPKNLQSPFMAISLDTRTERYADIEAGSHPYDATVRPQFVSPATAPEYHRLISAFRDISSVPALLNTSFNLHGEPIVNTIADAVRTFEFSGLDHLLIDDDMLISKR